MPSTRLILFLCLLVLGGCDAQALGGSPQAAVPRDRPVLRSLDARPVDPRLFPDRAGRVVDDAALLTEAEEAQLARLSASLEAATTDQLVIVTVPSLGGETIERFGLTLGQHWRVGQVNRSNGVLLIVAPGERKVRIEVGCGLESILTDAAADRIIQTDLLPPFRSGRSPEGIRSGAQAVQRTLMAQASAPRRGECV